MLDEGVCLLCGRPAAPNAAYCSQECSTMDSSSSASPSASAPSSALPSPLIHPVDVDNGHHSDVPSLIRSSHNRNRQSMSSTSTLDSEESATGGGGGGGDHHHHYHHRAAINYSRRPSTTNQRSTIPTLMQLHHRRTSSIASATSGLSFAHSLEHDSAFAVNKALQHLQSFRYPSAIASSVSSSSSSSSSSCSDEECHPAVDRANTQRTITNKRAPLKKRHRVSLPSYFSRLSVVGSASSPPNSDIQSGVMMSSRKSGENLGISISSVHDASPPAFSPSPQSQPSSVSGFTTSSTLTARRMSETTPRGRGRDKRVVNVRQGTSRSPPPPSSSLQQQQQQQQRMRRRSVRSPSRSLSSRSLSSSSASPSRETTKTPYTTRRGRNPIPRAVPPPDPFGLAHGVEPIFPHHGYAGSLGERAIRAPDALHFAPILGDVPRGRRTQRNDWPEGEPEQERGRNRFVVRRGSMNSSNALPVNMP